MTATRNQGLLFIPDISGFSRFVTEMEIQHSRMIISELLEVIIDANEIGLEVSEVEGDAVLFYRFGNAPRLGEMAAQVERMFVFFHERLSAFDATRFCQCQACVSACDLMLKIITHHGEFTVYSVKQFNKLIGRDVVVAHQLLKNDIGHHEYWLITADVYGDGLEDELPAWIDWCTGVQGVESGELTYRFTPLGALRGALPTVSTFFPEHHGESEVLEAARDYDADLPALFRAVADLDYRPRWQDGVRSVEYRRDMLPRLGMRSVQFRDSGPTAFRTSGYQFSPERIVLEETAEDHGSTFTFTGVPLAGDRSRLTVTYHLPKKDGIEARMTYDDLQRSLTNLERLVPELRLLATQ